MRPGVACFVWRVSDLCTRHVVTKLVAARNMKSRWVKPRAWRRRRRGCRDGPLLQSDAWCVYSSSLSYRPWIRLDSRSSRIDTNPLRARCPLADRLKIRISVLQMAILRKQIFFNSHGHPTAGHFGNARTASKIKRNYYWPGLDRDVASWIKQCRTCLFNKRSAAPIPVRLPHKVPEETWDVVFRPFLEPGFET